jgi:protein-L-isoaspartate(D-aspartate) O-methyltransferase
MVASARKGPPLPRCRTAVLGASGLILAVLLAGGCEQTGSAAPQDRQQEVRQMVDSQIRGRGVRDERVLDAMRRVPRHEFVPVDQQQMAYGDHPLPIGYGQTISQPYIVGFMTEALMLTESDVVLEIGTGSGYQAAILAEIAREVYSIELVPALAERARETLARLGYRNVHIRAGDGYQGWPEHAPFSRIIVTAAPEEIPRALVEQLAVGGRMVLPVGPSAGDQELRILTKSEDGIATVRSLPVRFVPMVKRPPS